MVYFKLGSETKKISCPSFEEREIKMTSKPLRLPACVPGAREGRIEGRGESGGAQGEGREEENPARARSEGSA